MGPKAQCLGSSSRLPDMRSIRSLSSLFFLFLALSLAGFGGCGEAPWLSGQILVDRDGKLEPVGGARVFLYPKAPLKKGKEAPEDLTALSSVSTTRDSGNFEFGELSSNVSYENYELMRNWTYRLRIEDTAFYIKDILFDFEGGENFVEVILEEKSVDVEAEEGGAIGEDGHMSTSGSVRRK